MSSYDPLCATVVSVDTVHSVIFTYGFRPTAPAAITLKATQQVAPRQGSEQRIDGVWWKHSSAVSGFISLSNTTGQSVNAKLLISGSDGSSLGAYPVSLAPHAAEVVDLLEFRSASATAGGAQLTYEAPAESILVSGGMEDIWKWVFCHDVLSAVCAGSGRLSP